MTEALFGIHIGNEGFAESRRVSGDLPIDPISGKTLVFAFTDLNE